MNIRSPFLGGRAGGRGAGVGAVGAASCSLGGRSLREKEEDGDEVGEEEGWVRGARRERREREKED